RGESAARPPTTRRRASARTSCVAWRHAPGAGRVPRPGRATEGSEAGILAHERRLGAAQLASRSPWVHAAGGRPRRRRPSRRFDVEAEPEAASSLLVLDLQHVLAGREALHDHHSGAPHAVPADQLDAFPPYLAYVHREPGRLISRDAQRHPDALGAVWLE